MPDNALALSSNESSVLGPLSIPVVSNWFQKVFTQRDRALPVLCWPVFPSPCSILVTLRRNTRRLVMLVYSLLTLLSQFRQCVLFTVNTACIYVFQKSQQVSCASLADFVYFAILYVILSYQFLFSRLWLTKHSVMTLETIHVFARCTKKALFFILIRSSYAYFIFLITA